MFGNNVGGGGHSRHVSQEEAAFVKQQSAMTAGFGLLFTCSSPNCRYNVETHNKDLAATMGCPQCQKSLVQKEWPNCELCGCVTRSTGTKRCDRCWELESRIHSDPILAQKILAIHKEKSNTVTAPITFAPEGEG